MKPALRAGRSVVSFFVLPRVRRGSRRGVGAIHGAVVRAAARSGGLRADPDSQRRRASTRSSAARCPATSRSWTSSGRDVRLGDFFGTRPVLLVLAYYECPMLCNEVLSAMVGSIETLSFNPGRDFEVVVVSFNPGDTPAMAAAKKATYLKRYGRVGTDGGFHFLTGRPESIKTLTEAVGFHYAFEKATGQYAHPAVLHVLTSQGRLSRYLYGIDFPPRDLRLALVEAADGKIGTKVDQFLLYCYHYDPQTGRYGFAILNAVRLAAC